jgi:cyclin B
VNILNTDGNVNSGKIKIIENIEINNGIDVEIVIEKENYNSLGKANNTPVTLDISYKPCNNNLKQNGQILNNKYINQNFLFKNPQIPFDYLDDIYEHLKATEYDLLPKYGYMKEQKDLNEKMRAILIDWLVDVHLKFELLPETLFLTTQLIDRFLGKKEINRNRLQLVGVTALYIACKYEEIYPPELKDFVYITDKAYTKADILSMEYEILNELNFSITQPSSLLFLQVLVEISQLKFDENIFLFARYLLELYLIEYRMIKYPPSWIAAATLYITIRVKKLNSYHKKIDIPKITGYNEEKLKECARDICIILDNAEKSSLQAVKIKYSSSKFLEVAKWKKN